MPLNFVTSSPRRSNSPKLSPFHSLAPVWWVYRPEARSGSKIRGRCKWSSLSSLGGSRSTWAHPRRPSVLARAGNGRSRGVSISLHILKPFFVNDLTHDDRQAISTASSTNHKPVTQDSSSLRAASGMVRMTWAPLRLRSDARSHIGWRPIWRPLRPVLMRCADVDRCAWRRSSRFQRLLHKQFAADLTMCQGLD